MAYFCQHKQGLRNEDSLSALLAQLLCRISRNNWDNEVLNYLQYAEDTFIIIKGEVNNVRNLKVILTCCSIFSALKINYKGIFQQLHRYLSIGTEKRFRSM